jgi:hypothetical protein
MSIVRCRDSNIISDDPRRACQKPTGGAGCISLISHAGIRRGVISKNHVFCKGELTQHCFVPLFVDVFGFFNEAGQQSPQP